MLMWTKLVLSLLMVQAAMCDEEDSNPDALCQDLAKEESPSCVTKSTIWTFDASTGNCVVKVGCYPRPDPENNVFGNADDCLNWCAEVTVQST